MLIATLLVLGWIGAFLMGAAGQRAYDRKNPPSVYVRIGNWFLSGDTGLSSRALAAATLGGDPKTKDRWGLHDGMAYPHDVSDFARCYRLLERVPECREGMARLAQASTVWAEMEKSWPLLTRLYEEGEKERLYSVLKSCQGRA